jgi:imidazolonepropionase-like amidohydrolase
MLVVDRREIEFDADSLAYYLSILPQEAEGLGLPATPPSQIRFDPKEGIVDAVYGKGEQARAFQIPDESLSAILISYCIRTRIPLPRVADKMIRVAAGSVFLTFKTWFDEAPVFDAKEAKRAAEATKSWKFVEPGHAAGGL